MRDRTRFVRKHMKADVRAAVERNLNIKHVRENLYLKDDRIVHVCFGDEDVYVEYDDNIRFFDVPMFMANYGEIKIYTDDYLKCGRCGTSWVDKKLAMACKLRKLKI